MLKSWKVRAAMAGVAMAAAQFALAGQALAVPPAPVVTSVTPSNGAAGATIAVTGTNCGTTTIPATDVELFLTGPGIPTPTAVPGTVVAAQGFTGTLTIPAGARPGEVFSVVARCIDATGTGPNSTGSPTFTVAGTGLTTLTGVTTATLSGVTGGLTGTSGTTTATTGTTGTTGTTTGTTGVPTPIVQQPTFTG